MCITRVGRVLSVSGGKARIEFFDGREDGEVDVTVVEGAKRGTYLEVYGNLALSVLSNTEARERREAWAEIRRAAIMPPVRRGRR